MSVHLTSCSIYSLVLIILFFNMHVIKSIIMVTYTSITMFPYNAFRLSRSFPIYTFNRCLCGAHSDCNETQSQHFRLFQKAEYTDYTLFCRRAVHVHPSAPAYTHKCLLTSRNSVYVHAVDLHTRHEAAHTGADERENL